MTCIVGIVKNHKVYLGGDSAYTRYYGGISIHPNTKVFTNTSVIMGGAGSARALNLLRYHLNIPEIKADDLLTYMATDFINAMRACYKENGYASKENEVEGTDSLLLVGVQGRLFSLDFDYNFAEIEQYTAIGSGADIALGALYATERQRPVDRIKIALKAAEQFNIGVRGPFQILWQ